MTTSIKTGLLALAGAAAIAGSVIASAPLVYPAADKTFVQTPELCAPLADRGYGTDCIGLLVEATTNGGEVFRIWPTTDDAGNLSPSDVHTLYGEGKISAVISPERHKDYERYAARFASRMPSSDVP